MSNLGLILNNGKSKQETFVSTFWQYAKLSGAKFGLNPIVILAQSAIESDWGTSPLAENHNNFFAITVGNWTGEKTQSSASGLWFRKYGTPKDSFFDFGRLISTKYKSAATVSNNVNAYATAISQSPYITEKNGDNRTTYKNGIIKNAAIIEKIAAEKGLSSGAGKYTTYYIAAGVIAAAVLISFLPKQKPLPQPAFMPYMPQPYLLRGLGANQSTYDNINKLHPLIRAKTKQLIKACEAAGIPVYIPNDGNYRTFEKQNELYAKGRTVKPPYSTVTNAKGGESFHNYGLAVDIVPVNGGYFAPYATYKKIGDIGKSLGWEWGGDWQSFKDLVHFQITFGKSKTDLLELYQAGKRDANGYVMLGQSSTSAGGGGYLPILIAGGAFLAATIFALTRKPKINTMPMNPYYRPYPYLLRGLGNVECKDGYMSERSGRGVCSRHGGKKGGKNCDTSCFAVWYDTNKIYTDESRFQNRVEKYSKESVQKLVDSFDVNKLDPITVWKDVDGKVYVLSGHSRFEAHKILNKKQIPVRFFEGTEGEAIRYGKVDANRSGTAETLMEDIQAYKLDRDGSPLLRVTKLSKDELKKKWKDKTNKLEAYSYLNPKGLFLEYMAKDDIKAQFPYIENKAYRVGLWRREYPLLTNAHEKEIFLYWYSPTGLKMKFEDVEDKINRIVSRLDFDQDKPLNLDSTGNRGTDARADTGEAQKRLYEIEKEADSLLKLRRNVQTKSEKDRINAELEKLSKEKERLERNIKTVLKTQSSLFGLGNILTLGCCQCESCKR